MSSRSLTRLALAAAATALATPAAAQAKTYCVNAVACPGGGVSAPTVKEAIADAELDADADEIRVGPGTYAEDAFAADTAVDIIGAGVGQTTIVPNSGTPAVKLDNASSSISEMSIRMTYDDTVAMELQSGADATRVKITSSDDTFSHLVGFQTGDSGSSTLDSVETDLGYVPLVSAVQLGAGSTLIDSKIVGGIGVTARQSSIVRSTVQASIGIRSVAGLALNLSNVLVTAHPRNAPVFQAGVQSIAGPQGQNASVTASHLTVVGPPSTGAGIVSRTIPSATSGNASLTVSNTVVFGTSNPLVRSGSASPRRADLSVLYSSYDGANVSSTGAGDLVDSLGNDTSGSNPRFVDPAGQDFRPRHDSPLVDTGDPAGFGTDAQGDRLKRSRVRNGDGTGDTQRDIGAFEYQRLAPTAAFDVSPGPLLPLRPVGFANASEDPDGDLLSHAWDFGDGGTSAAPNPTHAYSSNGTRSATLTATDPTGLSDSASRLVRVDPYPTFPHPPRVAEPVEVAPALSRASLLRTRFAAVRRGTKISARGRRAVKRGTRFRFTLSKPARVSITLEREGKGKVRGRGKSRRCVAATRRNRGARACTRFTGAGTLTAAGAAGAQSVDFTGRVRGRALVPGRYRARLVAADSERRRSQELRLSFVIVGG